MTFWKIMKPLSEKYRLIMVDQLGMGASSRPDFTITDAEEGVAYLVDWVEGWRKSMNNLTGFVLAGHSFGGFISGHYACKYPEHVKKLLLLSPFGIPKRHFTDDEFDEEYKKIQPFPGREKKPPKIAFKIIKMIWKKKWSPFGALRASPGWINDYYFNKWAKRRIVGDVPEEELTDFKSYMKEVLTRKGSVEYALFVIFDHYCFSKVPLDDVDKLQKLNIPITFVYGDRDWMKLVGNHTVLETNTYPHKEEFSKNYTVENSDHHLYFDNPQQFAQIILEDLANLDKIPYPHQQPANVEEILKADQQSR